MKNHKFIYAETINNKNVYRIKCEKTGGEITTEHWKKGLVQQNFCPCCNCLISIKGGEKK